jgi:hypothetical protein
MGHFELQGFELYAGYYNEDKGQKKDFLDKFDMVLTGHFHHRSSRDNIHYLGSPYEMLWSDYDDGTGRGFHVFDTETRELKFIENKEKIFFKLPYNDKKETFESIVNKDFSHYTNKYVKVIVQRKTNPYWFDQFMDGLYKENPADVSIIEASMDDSSTEEVSLEAGKDTLTFLTDYVNGMNVESHKNELIEQLRTLYIEAVNLDIE